MKIESAKLCGLYAHVSTCLACSYAVPCMLSFQRALRAYVPCMLTYSCATIACVLMCSMPCVLMCSCTYVPCMLTCSSAYVPCTLMCSQANMSCMLTCSCVNMSCLLCVPMCSHAITTNDRDKFSIICFPYIFVIVLCLFL